MNDPLLMRRFQRIRYLPRDWNCFSERNRTALDPLRQRFSWHQFHDEKVTVIDLFQSVNGGDVGMIQRCQYQTGKWSSSQSDHIRAYRKSAPASRRPGRVVRLQLLGRGGGNW